MNLDEETIRAAYALADRELRKLRRERTHIPNQLLRLHNRLTLAMQCTPEPEDTSPLIDARQAAAIIGVSERRVRQIAPDLGGVNLGWQWAFRADTVMEYARAKKDRNGR